MPIVEGAGTMSGKAGVGEAPKVNHIEAAMIAAIKKAMAEGITDPDVIRERSVAAAKEAAGG
jgi:hypothetical protein